MGGGHTFSSMVSDDIACAMRLRDEAQLRLRNAAAITLADIVEDEAPEPDTRAQTQRLTGLTFDDLVKKGDVLSRRPYVCAGCGESFTVEQYHHVRNRARISGEPKPFTSGRAVHEQ